MRLQSKWVPHLATLGDTPAERLMHALAGDIVEGRLEPGSRVPAHRDIANSLGIGLGSVTKACVILEKRGLIRTDHGRGTFVAIQRRLENDTFNLSVNTPPAMLSEKVLAQTLVSLSKQIDPTWLTSYPPAGGHAEHRQLMANWLRRAAFTPPPSTSQLMLCDSAQQALCAAFALLCKPGSKILTEPHTYPGALALSNQLGYQLIGCELDSEGLTPDSLESKLKEHSPRPITPVIYVTPTLHNPTTVTMSEHRRRAVAKLAKKYNALIIEDEVYALALSNPLRPIASYAPERTFYLSSLSKTLSPGLRIGSLVVPVAYVAATEAVLRGLGMVVSPLSCAVMSRWVEDGTAESMVNAIRAEIRRRTTIARSSLGGIACFVNSDAIHLWIPLKREEAEYCRSACASLGILLTPPTQVTVDQTNQESGLRVCIGATSISDLAHVIPQISSVILNMSKPSRSINMGVLS
jgi:DNA-binding transcriptional MocR family regulator